MVAIYRLGFPNQVRPAPPGPNPATDATLMPSPVGGSSAASTSTAGGSAPSTASLTVDGFNASAVFEGRLLLMVSHALV